MNILIGSHRYSINKKLQELDALLNSIMNSNEEQRLINSINKLSRKVMFDKFDIFRRQSEIYVLLLQNTGLSGKNIHIIKD